MGPLDVVWHVLNFFAPALGVGLLAALAAKFFWRRELAAVRIQRLAGIACATGAVASIGGLIAFGRDGRMATYGLLVIANAAALWWAAFGPGHK